jgi:hypothetical protein
MIDASRSHHHGTQGAGLFKVRQQDEMFGANADSLVCGSLAPAGTAVAVDGGVRLRPR